MLNQEPTAGYWKVVSVIPINVNGVFTVGSAV